MSVPPRPDASMDLLRTVRESALEPGYGTEGAGRQPHRVLLTVTLVLLGLLLGLAFGATTRAAPEGADERARLIARIRQLEGEQDVQRARVNELTAENTELGRRVAGVDPNTEQRLQELATAVGAAPVTGPGLRITLDDGPPSDQGVSRVLDADVRVLVNALWASGAEAVSVNGHRLSARVAIREAGDAITVDYRSLTRPYTVEAIGDPVGLSEGLASSRGGAWWRGLQEQYQMRFSVETVQGLVLDADPGLGVERARPVR